MFNWNGIQNAFLTRHVEIWIAYATGMDHFKTQNTIPTIPWSRTEWKQFRIQLVQLSNYPAGTSKKTWFYIVTYSPVMPLIRKLFSSGSRNCRNYFFMFLKWSIPVAYAIQISMCRLRKALGRKCILNAIPVEHSLLLVKAVVWICKGWRNSQTLPPWQL